MLTSRDEELIDTIIEEIVMAQHINIQAASYTIYRQLSPDNKKPLTQREFHNLFKDNLKLFEDIEKEYFKD